MAQHQIIDQPQTGIMDSVSSGDINNQTQNSTNNITMAEPSTSDAVIQEPTKKSQDYEDLFPKLPGAAPTSISGNNNSH